MMDERTGRRIALGADNARIAVDEKWLFLLIFLDDDGQCSQEFADSKARDDARDALFGEGSGQLRARDGADVAGVEVGIGVFGHGAVGCGHGLVGREQGEIGQAERRGV